MARTSTNVNMAPAGLDEGTAERAAARFRALSDPVRLRLLSLIAACENAECCACDLVDELDRSQPTISHHLNKLFEAGLVAREKRGTWVWYSVVPEALDEMRETIEVVRATSCPSC